jgi:hypothetical protein
VLHRPVEPAAQEGDTRAIRRCVGSARQYQAGPRSDGQPVALASPVTPEHFQVQRVPLRAGITMKLRVRKAAHVFERIGLAMAGAACGLFVAVHVGSSIAALTSQGFLLVMMIAGAVGFYLGIDTPSQGGFGGKVDTAELLSALGTFLATLAAFVSVGLIVLRENPHGFWTIAIMVGWVVGLMMQIVVGAITRIRA